MADDSTPEPRRPQRQKTQVNKFQAGFSATSNIVEPVSYNDAIESRPSEEWTAAIDAEMQSQYTNALWTLVARPEKKSVFKNRCTSLDQTRR